MRNYLPAIFLSASLLTLLTGAELPPLDGLVDRITAAHPGLAIEVQEGGQPHYPLLLGAE